MEQNSKNLKNNIIYSDNYKKLGLSIVIQAISDYKKCYYDQTKDFPTKKELERFFQSQWCYYLITSCCDMDMEIESILPTIQKYIENKIALNFEIKTNKQNLNEDLEIELT